MAYTFSKEHGEFKEKLRQILLHKFLDPAKDFLGFNLLLYHKNFKRKLRFLVKVIIYVYT